MSWVPRIGGFTFQQFVAAWYEYSENSNFD